MLRRVRDFANVAGEPVVTAKIADSALNRLEVDALGLDAMDRRYLHMIADIYRGGPVGVQPAVRRHQPGRRPALPRDLPAVAGNRLDRGGRHDRKHLAHVRARVGAIQRFVKRLAPPTAQRVADQWKIGRREIGDMWRMLTSAVKARGMADWAFSHGRVTDRTAHWEATYRFSATGRLVRNVIDAEFEFDAASRAADAVCAPWQCTVTRLGSASAHRLAGCTAAAAALERVT